MSYFFVGVYLDSVTTLELDMNLRTTDFAIEKKLVRRVARVLKGVYFRVCLLLFLVLLDISTTCILIFPIVRSALGTIGKRWYPMSPLQVNFMRYSKMTDIDYRQTLI
jgi:hypothetical protein